MLRVGGAYLIFACHRLIRKLFYQKRGELPRPLFSAHIALYPAPPAYFAPEAKQGKILTNHGLSFV